MPKKQQETPFLKTPLGVYVYECYPRRSGPADRNFVLEETNMHYNLSFF